MATSAIGFGVALIVLGVGSYLASDTGSRTAFIPSAFGLVLVILGLVAQRPGARRHAMHAAAGVALLGFLAAAGRGIPAAIRLLQGEGGTALGVGSQLAMAALLGVFVFLCVQSFRAARREQRV